MRVIDKRRDYYDNIVGEPEPVWVRKEMSHELHDSGLYLEKSARSPILPKEITDRLINALKTIPEPDRYYRTTQGVERGIVGFCGEYYPLIWHKQYIGRPQDVIADIYPSRFVEKYNASRKQHDVRPEIILSDSKKPRWFGGMPFNDFGMMKWMQTNMNLGEMGPTHDIFQHLGTPIFMVYYDKRNVTLTVNPLLVNYGFQCVVNPWDAYQAIDMYLGNELAVSPLNDFEMDDTLKRDSKGMDEWSFKQKGPKKRKY